jgi:hypothetical protein
MIFLSDDTWPMSEPTIALPSLTIAGVEGRRMGPSLVPVPFPAVLNAGIAEFRRLAPAGVEPTHVLLGPKAFERFEEYFNFSRSMRVMKAGENADLEMAMTATDAGGVNGLEIVRTVDEGMRFLSVREER